MADGVGGGEDAGGQELQEGQLLLRVERGDLVVSVFAVVQPYLSDLCLATGQWVREVVVDAEGLAEIPQFLVGLPPNEPVPAELEELVTGLLLQVGSDDELFGASRCVLPLRAKLGLGLQKVKAAEFIVLSWVGQCKQCFFLIELSREGVYSCDG